MKSNFLLSTLLLLAGASAQAQSIPDGSYRGEGLWKGSQERGTYEVLTTVAGSRITSTYKWAGGSRETVIELRDAPNGFLRVFTEGKEVGSGYCLERVALCHYSLKTDKLSLEETLTIQEGKLYKFGSKKVAGATVMWQEGLEK